jgi:hypothetical protein
MCTDITAERSLLSAFGLGGRVWQVILWGGLQEMNSAEGSGVTDMTSFSTRPAAVPSHIAPGDAACVLPLAFRMMVAKRSFYR